MKKNTILSLGIVIAFMLFFNVNTINADAATLYPDYINDEEFATCLVNQNDDLAEIDQPLTQTEFDTFATDVDVIDCSEENVQIKDLGGIENFTNLSRLDLSNSIDASQDDIFDSINQVSSLEYLVLDNNDINEIPNLSLGNLEALSLKNNNISQIENLGNLPVLDSLFLDNNHITEMENLDEAPTIGAINLSSNQISEINLEGMDNLSVIILDDNNISSLEGIEEAENIAHLQINNNNISDLEELSHLDKLGDVRLSGNNIVDVSQFDYLNDSVYSVYADNQSFVDYELPSASYDEVVKEQSCTTDTSCDFDLYTKEINGGVYSQVIDNSSFDDVVTYSLEITDGLDYYDQLFSGGTYPNYSIDVTIINYKNVTATNGSDFSNEAQTSEDDLKQKLNVDIDVYDLDSNQYVSNYDDIYISDLGGYSYDDPQPNKYNISFKLKNDAISDKSITVTYTVYESSTISAEDNSVDINDAPTDYDKLFTVLSVEALDYDESNINSSIIVNNLDNYDFDNPQVGSYEFEFTVTGTDNIVSTTMATLTVTEQEVIDPEITDPDTTDPEITTDSSDETTIDNEDVDQISEIADTGFSYNMLISVMLFVVIVGIVTFKKYLK